MTYDEFITLAQARHSCRLFDTERGVERDLLEKALEAAHLAPSACNRQPYRFVVVTEPHDLAAIAAAYNKPWIKTAPAIIVAMGLHSQAWHREGDCFDATHIDVAIAIDHITLAAQALGLGTCWVCHFDAMAVARALNVEPGEEVVALLPIGHPAKDDKPHAKPRKPLNDLVQWR